MRYVALVYYPLLEAWLHFREEKFTALQEEFETIHFIYARNARECAEHLPEADFFIGLSLDEAAFYQASRLKAFFTCLAGRDKLPAVLLERLPCYFGSFHGELMAETVVGAMLYCNQNFAFILKNARQHDWSGYETLGLRRPLKGQCAAILGYGTIGQYTASMLIRLGMTVYGIQRHYDRGVCPLGGARFVHADDTFAMLGQCDHVISFLPATPETRNYCDSAFFQRLSPRACFYNFGRGTTVEETALCAALNKGQIHQAVIDVCRQEPLPPDSPLWETPGLLVMPHCSAFYQNYVDLHVAQLRQQLRHQLAAMPA